MVTMINQMLIVKPALDVIAVRSDTEFVPLAKRWSLDIRTGNLTPTSVVVIEIEVVLQRIRPNHVVTALGEPENNAT